VDYVKDHEAYRRPFVLMCKDVKVLQYRTTEIKIFNPHLIPIDLEVTLPKDEIAIINWTMNQWVPWCANRVVTMSRANFKVLFNSLGIQQVDVSTYKACVALEQYAQSLNDSYWVYLFDGKPIPKWSTISFRHNELNVKIAELALGEIQGRAPWKTQECLRTADLATGGLFPKGWFRDTANNVWLYKSSLYFKQGENRSGVVEEISASRILECFNIYGKVDYSGVAYGNGYYVRSKLMTSENLGIVHAWQVARKFNFSVPDLISFTKEKCIREYAQMMVVDYLLANIDRHLSNWGFWQDMITGDLCGLHDLYDHNLCFRREALTDVNYKSLVEPNKTMQQAALEYIKPSELYLHTLPTKDMFPSDLAFNTFYNRCREIKIPVRLR
jgi:hypothetical protein